MSIKECWGVGARQRAGEALDLLLEWISEEALQILDGNQKQRLDLHEEMFRYWDRTGQTDKIFSAYSREQIEAAITNAWLSEFVSVKFERMDKAVSFPDEEKERARIKKMDDANANSNKARQAAADAHYDRYIALADQILKENPELTERDTDGDIIVTISLPRLAEMVRERLRKEPRPRDLADWKHWPPNTRTILRAFKFAFTDL